MLFTIGCAVILNGSVMTYAGNMKLDEVCAEHFRCICTKSDLWGQLPVSASRDLSVPPQPFERGSRLPRYPRNAEVREQHILINLRRFTDS